MSVAPGPYQWQSPRVPNRRGETVALVLLVIVALIAFLSFGLQPATSGKNLPERPVGTSYEAFPLQVTFESAVAVEEAPGVAFKATGQRYFLVSMTAMIIGDRYLYNLSASLMFSLSAPGLLEYGEPANGKQVLGSLYRAPEGPQVSFFEPGVATPVLLVWSQSTDVPIPSTITIQVTSLIWAESSLEEGWVWRTDGVVAQTTVPVKQG